MRHGVDLSVDMYQDPAFRDEEFETVRREAEEARQTAAMAELQLSRTVIQAPFAGRCTKPSPSCAVCGHRVGWRCSSAGY